MLCQLLLTRCGKSPISMASWALWPFLTASIIRRRRSSGMELPRRLPQVAHDERAHGVAVDIERPNHGVFIGPCDGDHWGATPRLIRARFRAWGQVIRTAWPDATYGNTALEEIRWPGSGHENGGRVHARCVEHVSCARDVVTRAGMPIYPQLAYLHGLSKPFSISSVRGCMNKMGPAWIGQIEAIRLVTALPVSQS